jgi:hypothetical protein
MTFEQAVKALELRLPITKVPISARVLLNTLKEDVILAAKRPGSWEGANMRDVLRCHGFLKDY